MDRRNLLIGGGAVAVAAVGAGVYYSRRPGTPSSSGALSSATELLKPGPLGDIVIGQNNAPVTIIEYASMTCPHCATFANETYPKLKASYIDTGKVRYIFREFPLDDLGAAAAVLARCVGKKDSHRTMAFVETLFSKQNEWAVQQPLQPLLALARQAGIGEKEFETCLGDKDILQGVQENQQTAIRLNVRSTPTFFINGTMHSGSMSMDEIEKIIKPLAGS